MRTYLCIILLLTNFLTNGQETNGKFQIIRLGYTTQSRSPLTGAIIENPFSNFFINPAETYRIREFKEMDSVKFMNQAKEAEMHDPKMNRDMALYMLKTSSLDIAKMNQSFMYINSDSMKSRLHFFDFDKNEFIDVIDTLSRISWELIDSFKIIGRYNCQKAKGVTVARTYTAWYAVDIPINGGPDRIFGLPGLILEADATVVKTGEIIRFVFNKIAIPIDLPFDRLKYKFSTKTITAEENTLRSAKQLQNVKIMNKMDQ